MPVFEDANRAVVEAAYDKLDITKTADAITVGQSAPTLASDGVPLLGSSRAIAIVKPEATGSTSAKVYGYLEETGWFNITELARENIDDEGDAWKLNIGGPTRVALVLAGVTGTVHAWIARSFV